MNVQYAVKHGLVKASDEDVDNYLVKFKSQNEEQDWDIAQRRAEKALEHSELNVSDKVLFHGKIAGRKKNAHGPRCQTWTENAGSCRMCTTYCKLNINRENCGMHLTAYIPMHIFH